MKKILSLALVLCMVLSLMLVPSLTASAAEQVTIGATDTTVTLDGVTYNVIRTADEFKAITGANNYILANDINLAGTEIKGAQSSLISSWSGTLDGNGYSLTGYSITGANNSGLIDLYFSEQHVKISNLTVGSAASPIVITTAGNGGVGAIAGCMRYNSTLVLENCTVYVDMSNLDNGTKDTEKGQKGAFVGSINKSDAAECSIDFINCKAYGSVSGKNKIGGFLGCNYNTATVTFQNCESHVNVTGLQFVGGYIGIVQAKGVSVFESCASNAALVCSTDSASDYGQVGGFIGKNTGNCTFKLCTNNSTITGGVDGVKGSYLGIQDDGKLFFVLAENETLPNNYCGQLDKDTIVTTTYFTQIVISTVDELKAIAASGSYVLAENLTLTEGVTLNVAGLDVELDMNGLTVNGALTVSGAGKLTLSNGTLKSETADAALTVASGATVALNNAVAEGKDVALAAEGTLSVLNTTVTAEGNAIVCKGSCNVSLEKVTATAGANAIVSTADNGNADMSVTVKSGTYTSTAADAVAWGGKGSLTVDGGTFTGAADHAAVAQTNGAVTVTAGTLTGKDAIKTDAASNTASIALTVTGGALEGTRSALCCAGNHATYSITVQGGTLKGSSDGALYNDNSNAKIVVSGGAFDEEITAEYCEEYYVSVLNSETNLYEVVYHTCDYTDVAWEYMNSGSHSKACKICGEKVTEAHAWAGYTDNGDGTHSKVCSVCNSKSTSISEHTATYTDNGDGTHTATCSGCDMNAVSSHNTTVTALNDGTHKSVCSDCASETVEACSVSDGVCTVCGAKTAEDGGCASAMGMGAFAIMLMLAVPALTVRKRKYDL